MDLSVLLQFFLNFIIVAFVVGGIMRLFGFSIDFVEETWDKFIRWRQSGQWR